MTSKSEAASPQVLAELAAKQIIEGVKNLIEAHIAGAAAANEWVDQNHSPLGHRKHLELARSGKVPSRKVRRQVLIRKDDLEAYLDRHTVVRERREEDQDVDDIIETVMRKSEDDVVRSIAGPQRRRR